MPEINLLPWRERKRAQHRRIFWLMLVIVLLISVFVHLFSVRAINTQMLAETEVEHELTLALNKVHQDEKQLDLLENTISELNRRVVLFDSIRQQQSVPVLVLQRFSEHIPKGLLFTRVSIAADSIEVSGVAQQSDSITFLMQRLDSETEFTDTKLQAVSKIKQGEYQDFHEFLLKLSLNKGTNN